MAAIGCLTGQREVTVLSMFLSIAALVRKVNVQQTSIDTQALKGAEKHSLLVCTNYGLLPPENSLMRIAF